MQFFVFHLFQALGALTACSLELRSTLGRDKSFCDGLELEIEGAVPRILEDLMIFNNPPAMLLLRFSS